MKKKKLNNVNNDLERRLEEHLKVKEKNDDDFEKNLIYLSAGGLVLTITFLEKIVAIDTAVYKPLIILTWSLFSFTLISSLFNSKYSSWVAEKTYYDERDNNENMICNWEKRSRVTRVWNNTNSISLLLAIASFITFVSININV